MRKLSAEKSKVFDYLIEDEENLESLVAYAIYKCHKRHWASNFRDDHEREPTEEEDLRFAEGCSTSDALDRYRMLATDKLLAFAEGFVTDSEPQIARQAVEGRVEKLAATVEKQGRLHRQIFTNIIAGFVTVLVFLGLTVAADIFGVDPVDGLKALNGK